MATDERQPLTPEQYAVGEQVEKDGQRVQIVDTLTVGSGNTYLVVSHPGDPIGVLVSQSHVRDEFDAVAEEDRTDPHADAASAAQEGGTDGTGATGQEA